MRRTQVLRPSLFYYICVVLVYLLSFTTILVKAGITIPSSLLAEYLCIVRSRDGTILFAGVQIYKHRFIIIITEVRVGIIACNEVHGSTRVNNRFALAPLEKTSVVGTHVLHFFGELLA